MNNKIIHTKERLILTTIEVIDELGIQGFSTKEVTRRLGVSEGTLFKHFKTKNELLIAVLDYYSQYDRDIFESIRLKSLRPKEAMIYYVNSYVEYYENYPAITAITQSYDILTCDTKLEDSIKNIIQDRSNFLRNLIEQAQNENEINSSIKSQMLVDIINGFRNEICLRWRLNKYNFSLKEETISTLKVVLEVFG